MRNKKNITLDKQIKDLFIEYMKNEIADNFWEDIIFPNQVGDVYSYVNNNIIDSFLSKKDGDRFIRNHLGKKYMKHKKRIAHLITSYKMDRFLFGIFEDTLDTDWKWLEQNGGTEECFKYCYRH